MESNTLVVPNPAEVAKRKWIFTREPSVIIIRVLATGILPGLVERKRDEIAIREANFWEACARGLDPHGIRGEDAPPDTGLCLFVKESLVRINEFITDIESRGYKYVNGYYEISEEKGKVNVLVFSNGDQPAVEEPEALKLLKKGMRFNHCTPWLNPRLVDKNDPSKGSFRLDTINVAAGAMTQKPGRQLRALGNSYRLV